RPPQVQGAGVPMPDGFFARAGLVDGFERQCDFDELFAVGHGRCSFQLVGFATVELLMCRVAEYVGAGAVALGTSLVAALSRQTVDPPMVATMLASCICLPAVGTSRSNTRSFRSTSPVPSATANSVTSLLICSITNSTGTA